MRYCSHCGSGNIALTAPPGDSHKRYVCSACQKIFYSNPKIVAGCILEWQGRILLCRRAIEPAYGLWTVPAGFMENRESMVEAAAREAREEALADADQLCLHSIYDLRYVSQVYVIYRGVLRQGSAKTGHETLEVMLCQEKNVPWDSIAFAVVKESLRLYFTDRKQGRFCVHQGEIARADGTRALTVSRYREPIAWRNSEGASAP